MLTTTPPENDAVDEFMRAIGEQSKRIAAVGITAQAASEAAKQFYDALENHDEPTMWRALVEPCATKETSQDDGALAP